MPRTANDIPMTSGVNFPPPGKYICRCLAAAPQKSKVKKTPLVLLTFTTQDAMYQFSDPVFVTGKAINRLMLVASRLCQIPGDTPLSDDDFEAAKQLARYIVDNAPSNDVLITIEEQTEEYMVEQGPDIGQKKQRKRRRVAFSGYEQLPEPMEQQPATDESDLPF
ncbi:MAG: hypothetical protein ABIG61_12255 [Planctomycetota bacterium]